MISARRQGRAVRAFFAVDLPEGARRACAGVAARLRAAPFGDAVRWGRPEGYHVTLRFLGNVATEEVPALARAVGEAVATEAPFEVLLDAAQVLPSPRRPRVVALALAPEAPLEALAARVEGAVVRAGLAPERRAFRAHLTLGRVRSRRVPRVEDVAAEGAVGVPVHEVVLFRSDLEPEGSRYTPLERLPLGAAAASPAPDSP